jgi:hypothetical protein
LAGNWSASQQQRQCSAGVARWSDCAAASAPPHPNPLRPTAEREFAPPPHSLSAPGGGEGQGEVGDLADNWSQYPAVESFHWRGISPTSPKPSPPQRAEGVRAAAAFPLRLWGGEGQGEVGACAGAGIGVCGRPIVSRATALPPRVTTNVSPCATRTSSSENVRCACFTSTAPACTSKPDPLPVSCDTHPDATQNRRDYTTGHPMLHPQDPVVDAARRSGLPNEGWGPAGLPTTRALR